MSAHEAVRNGQDKPVSVYSETMASSPDPWLHSIAQRADEYEPYPRTEAVPHSLRVLLDQELRVRCISTLRWRCDALWRVEERILADSLFSVVEGGSGIVRLGDDRREERFYPGALISIPEGCPHSILPDPGTELGLVHFHFHARLYGAVDALSYLKLAGVVVLGPGQLELCRESAREYSLGAPGWNAGNTAAITLLLLRLLRLRYDPMDAAGLPSQAAPLKRLAPAFELINRRLSDAALRVEHIAAAACLSQAGLRKLFARHMGMAPAEFLRRRRMDHACVLLRTTDLRLDRVAEECGIKDASLFGRLFRRYRGVSPGIYRRGFC